MEFRGFTPETGAFLWELGFNNERPWFMEHKEQFERVLNEPFKALADETLTLVQQRFPDKGFLGHVSRIYRDARRLFGRGPYKDHLWFVIHTGSRHAQGPAFWFELDAATYSYGLGFWDATSASMDALRRQIDANPAHFERLVGSLPKKWRLWGEEYKRAKADRGEVINPWYNRRYISFGWEKDLEDGAFDERLPYVLADCFEKLMPMHDYLISAWLSGREREDA